MAKIIKTIYVEREARNSIVKKLPMTDKNMMYAPERQLYQKIATALNISPDEVLPFILEHIPRGLKKIIIKNKGCQAP